MRHDDTFSIKSFSLIFSHFSAPWALLKCEVVVPWRCRKIFVSGSQHEHALCFLMRQMCNLCRHDISRLEKTFRLPPARPKEGVRVRPRPSMLDSIR